MEAKVQGGVTERVAASRLICSYWLAGKCKRNPCRFVHVELSATIDGVGSKLRRDKSSLIAKNSSILRSRECGLKDKNSHERDKILSASTNGDCGLKAKSSHETYLQVCESWVAGSCTHGDKCKDLHSWECGKGISLLTRLEGHKKPITGIALCLVSEKLYSCSNDGILCVWDSNNGQCAGVSDLGGKVGSLISKGQWVLVGIPNSIKAWNTHTNAELCFNGPMRTVCAMAAAENLLFAGTLNGTILAWKTSPDASSFEPIAFLKGHSRAVVSLTIGNKILYSGSMDSTIRVWDIETLQCIHTLKGHSAVVMSLLCWDQYLFSCSLDQTIKVWAFTDAGNAEIKHTHSAEHGALALYGRTTAEDKAILFCSFTDNSVRLYDLPRFTERGRLFSRQEVRVIEMSPGGQLLTGDGAGEVSVWNFAKV